MIRIGSNTGYNMINLNNIKMNVIETSENGVVNRQTIFSFNQEQDLVYANYSGGKIAKGYLVGNLKGDKLEFTYCQVQVNGILDNGKSTAELTIHNGKMRLIEHFEWASRPGQLGVNIFEEL
jgi:hypothetical protein